MILGAVCLAFGAACGNTAQYTTVAAEDWRSYRTEQELATRNYFGWNGHTAIPLYPARKGERAGVTLVADPHFGQVVQILFPKMQGRAGTSIGGFKGFTPLPNVWVRFHMKFVPGWTTVGPDPAGHSNAYKIAFLNWRGFNSRMDLGFIGTQYAAGASAADAATGRYYGYRETMLPGSAARFGVANTGCNPSHRPPHPGDCEWLDNEWYQFVMHYQKTGENTARWQFWRRRLTRNNRPAAGTWTYVGADLNGNPGACTTHPACPTPMVRAFSFGVNKNKNNPTDMHLRWGPFEIVDGSRYANPFQLPAFAPHAPR